VLICISITLLVLYFYNMRMKQLQEKRVYLHETPEEEHPDEMESRAD
jgi:Ca2+/H+ antiporter